MDLPRDPWPTLAIAAGKGGTGKTLFATSLALVLEQEYPGRVQLLDCDVEEPNAHLLLRPVLDRTETVTVPVPQVDLTRCTRCGRCADACRNGALAVIRRAVLTIPELCSGCGVCSYVCPVDAISEVTRDVGVVTSGRTAEGLEFHGGCLKVGEAKSTPVGRAVKRRIRDDRLSLLDAPPGTACPMQEAIANVDYCVLVTEPTPFGLSDLRAAVETCRSLGVPTGIVINRWGSGFEGVEEFCEDEGLPLLGRVPQDRAIAEAYSRGEPALAQDPRWRQVLLDLVAAALLTIKERRGERHAR